MRWVARALLVVRLLGRYLNSQTEVERIRDLCRRAASEHVERTHSPTPRARARRYSSDEIDEIVAMYHQLRNTHEVARELGGVTNYRAQVPVGARRTDRPPQE
ncbi:hypothetical protein GCM10009808_04900 [Microbacterium sediminicola]|uniref:Uncharacterized protein n=1 Tax=Microbacterium sediminicola TaxID=415210 RepID=A0ABN2HNY2_9MICO